ncbi:uncharacterized protein DUF3618 [Mumia flava]|uniref:Uncharacterized protein DUF3618 n=1 Tax=Mumia flava TaxID=1348852 RepID=A0A0B2BPZ4_9ACTN|nr:DUF3618 domain-containing protein [Mumia flava]PJJ56596.1 uncharacterized protein DUF3618 [Mumia flava]
MTHSNDASRGTDHGRAADLQAEIDHTRDELAETVDQLAAKLDVKSRVRDQVHQTTSAAARHVRSVRDGATDEHGRPTPAATSVAAGVAAAAVAAVLVGAWLRRRQ